MAPEETKRAIAVMQAYADGKEIEFRSKQHGWMLVKEPGWQWYDFEYRVKPEPFSCWAVLHAKPYGTEIQKQETVEVSYSTRQECESWIKRKWPCPAKSIRIVKLVEEL